jgi:hypothetical protein
MKLSNKIMFITALAIMPGVGQSQELNPDVQKLLEEAKARANKGAAEVLAYPSLTPVCPFEKKLTVTLPKGSGGFYMNQDCSKLFLLPPVFRKANLQKFGRRMNLSLCEASLNSQQGLERVMAKIGKERENINTSSPDAVRLIEMLRLDAETYGKALEAELKRRRELAGADVSMSLDMSTNENYIKSAMYENRELLMRGVRFEMAPISHSYLSISKPGKDENVSNGILNSSFPAIQKESNDSQETVIANGGINGNLVLNLDTACPIAQAVDAGADLTKALSSVLAVNLSYSVPMYTPYGIDAEINFSSDQKGFKNLLETSKKFSLTKLQDAIMNSTDGASIKITLTGIETGLSAEAVADYRAKVTQIVRDLMTKDLLTFMQRQTGLFNVKDPEIKAPSGGDVPVQVGTRTSCTETRFLGVKVDEDCWNSPIIENVYYPGVANGRSSASLNLNFHQVYNEQMDSVLYRQHTSSFKFDTKKDENENEN